MQKFLPPYTVRALTLNPDLIMNSGHEVSVSYHLVGKFGVDGSGSHKVRQQLIDVELARSETSHLDPTKTSNFLLACYVPLELCCNNLVVWKNPVPNSTSFARPVSLTRTTEERDILSTELEPVFQSIIRNDLEVTVFIENKPVEITCRTECSMIDGKMVSLLQGDSGAFCHLCFVNRQSANDPSVIENGFEITKDYASTQKAWDQLVANEIVCTSQERQGQCQDNIVKADLHCFSVLHFKLRSLDFAQKVLYWLVCGQKDWKEDGITLYMMRIFNNAKKECFNVIQQSTGSLQ